MLSGYDVDSAVTAVERWWHTETKAFAIASALGGGNRLSLDILRDLRLILRWMRLKQTEKEFAQLVETLGRSVGIAAE
jgi:hypothetical protein